MKNRKELEKLQKEYNELRERMGYCRDESAIRAINNRLNEISTKMETLMKQEGQR